jgi:protease-4
MNPFLSRLLTDAPLMDSGALTALLNVSVTAADVLAAEAPFLAELREKMRPKPYMVNGVAVVPVTGTLMRRPSLFELAYGLAEDTAGVSAAIASATANPETRGIVLSIDSPGGVAMGGEEVAEEIAAARRKVPVVAHVGGMGASLAYRLAVEADQIVASTSSQVGSIGTVAAIADTSRMLEALGVKLHVVTNTDGEFKATGTPGAPVTEKALAYYQSRVDAVFAQFRSAVVARRPKLGAEHMRGQVYLAPEAKRIGMIDAVGSLPFAIAMARRGAGRE